MIYFSFIFINILYGLLFIITGSKYRLFETICFLLLAIGMVLLAGLRDGIGYDFESYKLWFHTIKSTENFWEIDNIEIGYILLNKLCTSFNQLILIIAIFSVGIKLFYINKYSKNKLLSMLLYFTGVYIMFDMGVIRQGLSISIALISIKYIIERRFLKFIFVIFVASLFHTSILIFIPLYFIGTKKFSRKFIYTASILSLIIYFLKLDREILMFISNLNIPIISNKLLYYYNSYDEGTLYISIIKRLIILIFFMEVYKRKDINNNYDNLFFNAYFLSNIIMCLFPTIPILSGRGNMSLYFMQVFIFSNIIYNINTKIYRILIYIFVILMSVNTMITIINHGNISGQPYIPYVTIFST